MPTKEELKALQALPLERKILITQARIIEWYKKFNGQVYVSFSGGKDSTVLLHIVRQMYPDIEAVFVNTGLEYPQVRQFVKSFDNVTILRPKIRFDEVIRKYGYPFIGKKQADTISGGRNSLKKGVYSLRLMELGITVEEAKEMELKLPSEDLLRRYEHACKGSKFVMKKYKPLLFVDFKISHYCCNVMKKAPMGNFQKVNGKVPITAQTTDESMLRESAWLKNGCNAFYAKKKVSNPMSFWKEQDILRYIKQNNLPIASVYGDICCLGNDGNLYDFEDRIFRIMASLCAEFKFCTTKCDRTGCIFCGFGAHLEKGESRFQRLKKTHPRQYEYCMGGGAYDTDGLWKPTKEGLGMAHCIDEINKIYGKDFIKY